MEIEAHMPTNKRAYILIVAGLLLAALTVHAEELCPAAYARIASGIEALDHEFEEAKKAEPNANAQGPAMVALLNRAFFPMMEQLSKSAGALTSSQVSSRWTRLQKDNPMFTSDYVNDIANVEHANSFQTVVSSNSNTAKYYYLLNQNPDIVKAKRFVYVKPDEARVKRHGIVAGQLELIITPETEYGDKFAANLLRTTEIMFEIADENLRTMSGQVYNSSKNLITSETARGKGAVRENAEPEEAPLGAMIEGIMSFQQLVTLVLATKVPGIHNGAEALQAFVHGGSDGQGLTSDIVFRLPMAVVGPAALSGYGFKGALELGPKGRLQITEAFKKNLQQWKDKQVAALGGKKTVCPMASFWRKPKTADEAPADAAEMRRQTGLQILAETYLRVFQMVEAHNPSLAP